MDQTDRLALKRQLLAGGESLYAVFDGASLANLPALLAQHSSTYVCLLRGELDPELAQVAPYLTALTEDSALLDLFLNHGLGQHWGILMQSTAEFRTLRMHCRGALSVWDETGRPLFFRYYDPRVLRVFLPTCNAADLRALFRPISAFFAEDEHATGLLRFTLGAEDSLTSHLIRAASAQPGASVGGTVPPPASASSSTLSI